MRQKKQPAMPEPTDPEPLEPDPGVPPDFALLGLCYDRTQTLWKGAALAPAMLREAFPKLETFVHGIDLTESGLDDLGDIETTSEKELHKQTAVRLGSTGKFPIILGGEHSVSLAAVKALKPDNVIILDAHPDCEAGEAHNAVTRRIAELIGPENVILLGPRSISAAEAAYLKGSGIRLITSMKDLKVPKGRTYLSVDLDVLDPSELSSVGNPEPMGMSFAEVSQAISAVAPVLIGADFVEFTPIDKMNNLTRIHALLAGKLIYSTMAAVVKAKKK